MDVDKTVSTAERTATITEWQIATNTALAEVKRLVSDGVPVMTRNVASWLLADSQELESDGGISTLQYPDAATSPKSWGQRMLDHTSVSYLLDGELQNLDGAHACEGARHDRGDIRCSAC